MGHLLPCQGTENGGEGDGHTVVASLAVDERVLVREDAVLESLHRDLQLLRGEAYIKY